MKPVGPFVFPRVDTFVQTEAMGTDASTQYESAVEDDGGQIGSCAKIVTPDDVGPADETDSCPPCFKMW